MVGKKEKRNVCLCNVWSPVNYVNTPTRCLETRETLLHLFLFPLYSSLPPPPSLLPTYRQWEERWRGEER